jgi:hypothetical protein
VLVVMLMMVMLKVMRALSACRSDDGVSAIDHR